MQFSVSFVVFPDSAMKRPFFGPAIFWILSMAANIFNWLFYMQASRVLTKEEFAVLAVFLSLQYLLTVCAGALTNTVSRFTAYYNEKEEPQKHFYFFRQYWWLSWTLGLAFFLAFFLFQGFLKSFFGFDTSFLTLIFALLPIGLFLVSFEKGALWGQLAFIWVGVIVAVEAGVKLAFLLISPKIPISQITATVIALPFSVFAAWLVSIVVVRSIYPSWISIKSEIKNKLDETYNFLGNSVLAGLGAVLISNIDVLLVKHFFSAAEAGIYSTLSLLGKTLYFAAGSLIGILIPLTARSQARGQSGRTTFFVLFGIITFVGISIWLSYVLIPEFVVSALLTAKGLAVLPYLANYSLGMFFLVLITCFTIYNLAKKNYLPARLTILASLAEGILIFFYHDSIGQIVNIVTSTLFILLLLITLTELFNLTTQAVFDNLASLLRLFANDKFLLNENKNSKRRVLIFNWRDIKHVLAGGSEVYLQEIGKRLSANGFEVTIFTSNDGRNLSQEKLDGISIVRRGGFITVYFWAALYYLFKFRGKYDVIIDSENGIPFFTPLFTRFTRIPVILLIHHVHQDVFFRSLIPPFSWIANLLEAYLMPRVYKNSYVITVSLSTSEDLLQKIGLTTYSIIPNGVDIEKYVPAKKFKKMTICYMGRLKQYKSIEVLLLAFKNILIKNPEIELMIAGEGDYRSVLEKRTEELEIKHNVKFLGRVSENNKIKILGKSWMMIQPSFMEGWGITCLEANACGTPVLASKVSGLKDSVVEGVNGYLFEYGNYQELATALWDFLNQRITRKRLSQTAREWSKKYSWVKQSEKFAVVIKKIVKLNKQSLLLRSKQSLLLRSKSLLLTKNAISINHEIR